MYRQVRLGTRIGACHPPPWSVQRLFFSTATRCMAPPSAASVSASSPASSPIIRSLYRAVYRAATSFARSPLAQRPQSIAMQRHAQPVAGPLQTDGFPPGLSPSTIQATDSLRYNTFELPLLSQFDPTVRPQWPLSVWTRIARIAYATPDDPPSPTSDSESELLLSAVPYTQNAARGLPPMIIGPTTARLLVRWAFRASRPPAAPAAAQAATQQLVKYTSDALAASRVLRLMERAPSSTNSSAVTHGIRIQVRCFLTGSYVNDPCL
jgi:hypothetical protein